MIGSKSTRAAAMLGGRIHRDGPRIRTNYPAWAMVLAVLAGGAGLAMIYGAVVHHAGNPPFLLACAGGIFALCGLILGKSTLTSILWRRRMRAVAGQPPWKADYRWDPSGTDDGAWSRARGGMWANAFIWLFVGPFHAFFFLEAKGVVRLVMGLVFGFMDLIMLVATGFALYRLWQALKFGARRLNYPGFPLRLGEPLTFRFEGGERLARHEGVKARLLCIHEYTEVVSSGNEQSQRVIYDPKFTQDVTVTTDAAGNASLSFHPPATAPGTDFEKGLYWEVEVTAELPGADYQGIFLVPIYAQG